ncbi:NADP-dependent malic mitochondrial-like, partial [Brachionus plicatilis]
VSFKIAVDIGKYAFEHDLSNLYPKPDSIENFVKQFIYDPTYTKFCEQAQKIERLKCGKPNPNN